MVNNYTSITSDADAYKFLNASILISDITIRNAIINLCTSLKSNGLWNLMEVIYPFVGGTNFCHKFNLKNPLDRDFAYRMSFIGTGTILHNNLGVTFNGISNYGNTFLLPTSLTTGSGYSMGFYSQTNLSNADNSAIDCGSNNGTSQFLFSGKRTNGDTAVAFSFAPTSITQTYNATQSGTGLWVGSRQSGDANASIWYNGTQMTPTTGTTTLQNVLAPYSVLLGARNNAGTVASYTLRTYSFFYVGYGLTSTQHANLYTIIQNFQTALGRQV